MRRNCRFTVVDSIKQTLGYSEFEVKQEGGGSEK